MFGGSNSIFGNNNTQGTNNLFGKPQQPANNLFGQSQQGQQQGQSNLFGNKSMYVVMQLVETFLETLRQILEEIICSEEIINSKEVIIFSEEGKQLVEITYLEGIKIQEEIIYLEVAKIQEEIICLEEDRRREETCSVDRPQLDNMAVPTIKAVP